MSWRAWAARLAEPVWHRLGGTAQWGVVWLTQPHFLVAVCGVVQDGEGRVLLLRPRFWPRGSWGLPAGYVKHGETVAAALVREVREETGFAIDRVDAGEVIGLSWFPPDALPEGLLETHRGHIRACR